MNLPHAAVLVAILGSAPWLGAVPLPEAWPPVQQLLAENDVAAAAEEVGELESAAAAVQAKRLTPYARALAADSIGRGGADATLLLDRAVELDPELPSARFLRSSRDWEAGRVLPAVAGYLQGWVALFRFEESRREILRGLPAWLLIGVAVALLTVMLVQAVRTARRLAFDAFWLGRSVFDHANGWVFAAVLIALPLFAGLDVAWLGVYLAVMGWIYLSTSQRGVAVLACLAMAAVLPALEAWQQLALRDTTLARRVSDMLEERKLDLASLREMADLELPMADNADFHLVLGELFRLHGEVERAREQYQRAVVAGSRRPEPLIFLGNLAQEDGDVLRAVQLYNRALEIDPNSVLAYHNLSSAYDSSRRFQEGDEARSRARQLAGGRSRSYGLGEDNSRLRYPRLGAADVAAVVATADPDVQMQLEPRIPVDILRGLFSPLSVVFVIGALVGGVVFWLRRRWLPPSRECTKCGKVFRVEDAADGSVYCQQCQSVYLRRERVSIEQQSAKAGQVRRWDWLTATARRAAGAVAPGGHLVIGRQPWAGLLLAACFWTATVGAVVWTPYFLPGIEPAAARAPVIVILASVAGLLWLRSAVGAWYRR